MTSKIKSEIIERFICTGISVKDIVTEYGIDIKEAYELVYSYYPKGNNEINIPSIATASNEEVVRHFWGTKSIEELMYILSVCKSTVQKIAIRCYLPKKKKVFMRKKSFGGQKRSIILNRETGIFYFSCREAGESINKNEDYIKRRILKGNAKNDTDFVYCGPFK